MAMTILRAYARTRGIDVEKISGMLRFAQQPSATAASRRPQRHRPIFQDVESGNDIGYKARKRILESSAEKGYADKGLKPGTL